MASLDDGQEATAGGVVEHDIEREPGGSAVNDLWPTTPRSAQLAAMTL